MGVLPPHPAYQRGHLPPKMDVRRASAPHSNLGTVPETEDDYRYQVYASGRRASQIHDKISSSGYDRPIRQASIARLAIPRGGDMGRDLSGSYLSDMPRTPTQTALSASFSTFLATPSDRLSPNGYQEHMLHARTSDSSLSRTSSGGGDGYSTKDALRSDESTPTRHVSYEEGNKTPTISTSPSKLSLASARPHQPPTSPAGPGNGTSSNGSWRSGTGSGPKAKTNSTSATVDFSTGRSIWC